MGKAKTSSKMRSKCLSINNLEILKLNRDFCVLLSCELVQSYGSLDIQHRDRRADWCRCVLRSWNHLAEISDVCIGNTGGDGGGNAWADGSSELYALRHLGGVCLRNGDEWLHSHCASNRDQKQKLKLILLSLSRGRDAAKMGS